MSLNDYYVFSDRFAAYRNMNAIAVTVQFPCSACVNNTKPANTEPCVACGHRGNKTLVTTSPLASKKNENIIPNPCPRCGSSFFRVCSSSEMSYIRCSACNYEIRDYVVSAVIETWNQQARRCFKCNVPIYFPSQHLCCDACRKKEEE